MYVSQDNPWMSDCLDWLKYPSVYNKWQLTLYKDFKCMIYCTCWICTPGHKWFSGQLFFSFSFYIVVSLAGVYICTYACILGINATDNYLHYWLTYWVFFNKNLVYKMKEWQKTTTCSKNPKGCLQTEHIQFRVTWNKHIFTFERLQPSRVWYFYLSLTDFLFYCIFTPTKINSKINKISISHQIYTPAVLRRIWYSIYTFMLGIQYY